MAASFLLYVVVPCSMSTSSASSPPARCLSSCFLSLDCWLLLKVVLEVCLRNIRSEKEEEEEPSLSTISNASLTILWILSFRKDLSFFAMGSVSLLLLPMMASMRLVLELRANTARL